MHEKRKEGPQTEDAGRWQSNTRKGRRGERGWTVERWLVRLSLARDPITYASQYISTWYMCVAHMSCLVHGTSSWG